MREITTGLWQIDEIGDSVHCFLWEWQDGVTLIDTGYPGQAETILIALRQQGYADHNLRRIILTHADLDHAGSILPLKRATGAKVACHVVEKEFLEHPNRRQATWWSIRPLLWLMSLFPGFSTPPIAPDELLVDGQVLPEGFTVIHTPGHTPGHIALLHREKRFLISGDALVNSRNRLRPNTGPFTPDPENAQRSVWRLAKKYADDFDIMVFGHGPPILHNGGKRLKALASRLFSTEV
ncbi:MAG: MBL fold metallo-hydrolase [Caldilineaceae bacterium]|nr:MBL fold metallo-hydrolase [Caldilineaceae bacterium]